MKKALYLVCIIGSFITYGQPAITYKLSLDHIQHHELVISATFKALEKDTLEIRMPNASPGRYALHNFAKNVYGESATYGSGKEAKLIRTTPFSWKIPLDEKEVTFQYTLFGNHADGTYVGIDANKIHLNMPATFAYGIGLSNRKIALEIDLSNNTDWSVATQLQRQEKNIFTANNYYYFFDSPTIAGDLSWRSWEVDGQTIEVAMLHEGTDEELDKYTEWIVKIVDEQKAVFGELPDFDFGKYTFLCAYNPWVSGDAMEHRNSTVCTSNGNLAQHAQYMIGSISHEFFHSWNIERIRPTSLEPFDFDNANLSGELWFGEGFTNYYDELSLCRAGIISQEKFLQTANRVLNSVSHSPGRQIRTPIQMSHNALFVDAGTANDATNYENNFISYYTYGELLGLALDISIRSKYKNLSLDDFMSAVWRKYGKTEKSYTMDDLEQTLGETVNDASFAKDFFESYIYASDLPDFKSLYENFGITMRLADKGKVYTGNVKLDDQSIIQSNLLKGTALYEAGMNKDDKLLSINGEEIDVMNFNSVINALKVGESYAVTYEQLGKIKSGKFVAKQDPNIKLDYVKNPGKKVIKMRESWLGSKG